MSSQHFDVVRVRVTVRCGGSTVLLRFLLQLCLRVICALFMQHSAHDGTCNRSPKMLSAQMEMVQ